MTIQKIGFGGGCHWCTEAVFQSLRGVYNVQQGWVASEGKFTAFSEAVILEFNPDEISLKALIEIHLHTHKSTSNHSMREKYRSAIYFFEEKEKIELNRILSKLQANFDNNLITQILPFLDFKPSEENFKNYYFKNPKKPFCVKFINPKLSFLQQSHSKYVNEKH